MCMVCIANSELNVLNQNILEEKTSISSVSLHVKNQPERRNGKEGREGKKELEQDIEAGKNRETGNSSKIKVQNLAQ